MLGILADCLTLLDTNGGGSGSSSGTINSPSSSPSSGVKRLPSKHITTGYHSPPVLDAQAVANILLGTIVIVHMIILIVVMVVVVVVVVVIVVVVVVVVVMVAIVVTHALIISKFFLLLTYFTLPFDLLHIIHFYLTHSHNPKSFLSTHSSIFPLTPLSPSHFSLFLVPPSRSPLSFSYFPSPTGLRGCSSRFIEVRHVLTAVCNLCEHYPRVLRSLKAGELSMAIWGLQGMSNDHVEVDRLVALVCDGLDYRSGHSRTGTLKASARDVELHLSSASGSASSSSSGGDDGGSATNLANGASTTASETAATPTSPSPIIFTKGAQVSKRTRAMSIILPHHHYSIPSHVSYSPSPASSQYALMQLHNPLHISSSYLLQPTMRLGGSFIRWLTRHER